MPWTVIETPYLGRVRGFVFVYLRSNQTQKRGHFNFVHMPSCFT